MSNPARVPRSAEDHPPGELIVGPWKTPEPEPEPDPEPEPLPPAAVAVPRCAECDWPTHVMVSGNLNTGERWLVELTHAAWAAMQDRLAGGRR
jgi:hypothetical protein